MREIVQSIEHQSLELSRMCKHCMEDGSTFAHRWCIGCTFNWPTEPVKAIRSYGQYSPDSQAFSGNWICVFISLLCVVSFEQSSTNAQTPHYLLYDEWFLLNSPQETHKHPITIWSYVQLGTSFQRINTFIWYQFSDDFQLILLTRLSIIPISIRGTY